MIVSRSSSVDRRRLSTSVVVVLAASLSAACGNELDVDCAAGEIPAVQITVVDSARATTLTVNPVFTFTDAAGTAMRTLKSPQQNISIFNGYGPAGTYKAVVQADGYRDYVRDGISVSNNTGKCGGVNTVSLLARMQPAL
jgi:hypothetical protein